jgi:NAD(P)H dehydrogenase (quinone)
MNIVMIDGHPDSGRLVSALMDLYEAALSAALPAASTVTRFALRDLRFDPVLHRGYTGVQALEPDLERLLAAIEAADHLMIGFPLWWGAEPALVKGLLDRALLPGRAFRYHTDDLLWDRLLSGRSADLMVTMDTPPWYLRLVYGDAVITRWKRQVLGFVGCKPVRVFRFGPTKLGNAEKKFAGWARKLQRAAASVSHLKRAK